MPLDGRQLQALLERAERDYGGLTPEVRRAVEDAASEADRHGFDPWTACEIVVRAIGTVRMLGRRAGGKGRHRATRAWTIDDVFGEDAKLEAIAPFTRHTLIAKALCRLHPEWTEDEAGWAVPLVAPRTGRPISPCNLYVVSFTDFYRAAHPGAPWSAVVKEWDAFAPRAWRYDGDSHWMARDYRNTKTRLESEAEAFYAREGRDRLLRTRRFKERARTRAEGASP